MPGRFESKQDQYAEAVKVYVNCASCICNKRRKNRCTDAHALGSITEAASCKWMGSPFPGCTDITAALSCADGTQLCATGKRCGPFPDETLYKEYSNNQREPGLEKSCGMVVARVQEKTARKQMKAC